MNHYISPEEMNARIRQLAVDISIENIDSCIRTLEMIKKVLVTPSKKEPPI